MQPNISRSGYKKIGFFWLGIKSLSYPKTALLAPNSLEEAEASPLDENIVKFSALLEDSSYKIMEKMPIQELRPVVTSDSMVAEGASTISKTLTTVSRLSLLTLSSHASTWMPILI